VSVDALQHCIKKYNPMKLMSLLSLQALIKKLLGVYTGGITARKQTQSVVGAKTDRFKMSIEKLGR
jgi:hypothetical protein